MTALDRKLWRDLRLMTTQATAIALVVAAGVAMYVMYLSNFETLRRTQQEFYANQRFADAFASLKRAPRRVADEIAVIPGVAAVEARVIATVPLHVPGLDAPASARLVSVPTGRQPRVNTLFLRRGEWPDPARPDDVVASEGFVTANALRVGDGVPAVINGRLRRLRIAGVALSPEYIYSIRPGELVPDDRRYAIFWMSETALAAAVDMEGGFNDIAMALSPGAPVEEVLRRVDQLLTPYGGLGAYPRSRQLSHWTLENELVQLQSFGFLLPLIFLLVAAFTLHTALSRMLALQRPQIAALKAIGYSNKALGWHYMKLALLIGAAGVVLGVMAGGWLGREIGDLYNRYFRFPHLLFTIPPAVWIGATAITGITAATGAATAVRRAVQVPPAEAMRPEAPARFQRSAFEAPMVTRRFPTAGLIVLRRLTQRPLRAGAAIIGIGFAVGNLTACLMFVESMERMITTQFWDVSREDLTVSFTEPRSLDAVRALAKLPGVLSVEPQRAVPARIQAGHRRREIALTGIAPDSRLRRIVGANGHQISPPIHGLVLSAKLAEVLAVRTGDVVTVEVLEGERPVRTLPVAATVDDLLGLWAYMELELLHDTLGEAGVASGAVALVDPAQTARLARELRALPAVGGVGFKRDVVRMFRDAMSANLYTTLFINVVFAAIIAFGVVYIAARVALSEQSYDLASLRVLGFTRHEISSLLLSELAVLTVLALPVGTVFGHALATAIGQTLHTEVYRFPLYITRAAVAWAWIGVVAAAAVSALLVRRRLDTLDLIAVLKVRE
jgi:putative ABC transport system permease protein